VNNTITNNDFHNSPLGAGGGAAMIFAAGLGTRLKPFTDMHPKALAMVNGKPLLQRNIEYLQQHGITNVIVNVHHFADQIIDAIQQNNGWGSQVAISDETYEVLETGGGLKRASNFFADVDDFVVMNADILTDLNLTAMLQSHKAQQPLATLATSDRSSSRYFLFNEADELCGWMNDKTGEQRISKPANVFNKKAFSGVHVISSKLLKLITQEGKFSMVDVYLELAKSHVIKSFDHSGSQFIDVGKPENIVLAESLFD
jgi:N-acetyl-alpha-D-muramate 1-phosphate uridylyltransferase